MSGPTKSRLESSQGIQSHDAIWSHSERMTPPRAIRKRLDVIQHYPEPSGDVWRLAVRSHPEPSEGRPASQKPSGATQRQQKAVWLRYEKSGQQQIVDEVFIRIYNSDHRWQISVSQNTSFCTRHLHVVWLRMASARRPDGS